MVKGDLLSSVPSSCLKVVVHRIERFSLLLCSSLFGNILLNVVNRWKYFGLGGVKSFQSVVG